jgi:hypothetical protein
METMRAVIAKGGLIDPPMGQAFACLRNSPGTHACHDEQCARGLGRYASLRQPANHLAGILHGLPQDRHHLRAR